MAKLEKLSGCNNPERSIDLIFVHGLDGDARTTWQLKDRPETFWPGWIGEDFPDIGVWSLDYDASSIAWRGDSMPLYDRANNVLNCFEQDGIAKRPIAFVCHSLGGLLIKQVLRNASDSKNHSWWKVTNQTRFILFLSTPHSGSGMANWIQYLSKILRTSISVRELEAHDPQLRQLNIWYRDHQADLGIQNFIYCEERKTARLPFGFGGILVVDKTSADPGIPGVTPIPLDEDHVSICKPESRQAQVYRQMTRMIEELVISDKPSPFPNPQTEPSAKPELRPAKIVQTDKELNYIIPGKTKVKFCARLRDSWPTLAMILEIPPSDQDLFSKGREAQHILDWLESRERLYLLQDALKTIDRQDLADLLPNPD